MRASLFVTLLFFAQVPPQTEAPVWPTAGCATATPQSLGFDPAALAAIDQAARDGTYGNVDAIVVTRHGRLIADYRYTRDYPAIIILLMTAYADQRERASNLDALVHDVILKPFTLAEIKAAVSDALASKAKP
jgi:CheY-like chemotaxis protein